MPGSLGKYVLIAIIVLLSTIFSFWPSSVPKFVVCDVGQGDALLVIDGFIQVLIDGGRDEQVIECLNRHLPFWDRQLELVVLTHPDADHFGGLATVLQIYNVQKLLISSTKESADFNAFWQAVQMESQEGMSISRPNQGQTFYVSNLVKIQALVPPGLPQAETLLSAAPLQNGEKNDGERNYNDESIALFMQFGAARVLMVGDLEKMGEQALVDSGLLLDVDILKVGHHGSKTSTTPDFLAQVQPEFSLISLGENNSYGHPHLEVIARLEVSGSQIKRTDELGDIVMSASVTNFWFE